MISFANPAAFLLFFLTVPIVALYFKRPAPRRISVSSSMFWNAFEGEAADSKWQTLRHPLSLILQLLLLCILILAAAAPTWTRSGARPVSMVIVLDNSASMKATDVKPNRFGIAKSLIRNRIRNMNAGDTVTLIPMIPTGSPFQLSYNNHSAGNAQQAEEWLNQVVATDVPESPELIDQLVQRLQRIDTPNNIAIYSDSQQLVSGVSGASGQTNISDLARGSDSLNRREPDEDKSGRQIESHIISRTGANAGITSFRVIRDTTGAPEITVTLEVFNASQQASQLTLLATLKTNSTVLELDQQRLELKPEERRRLTLNLRSVSGGILTVSLSRFADSEMNCLNTDDTASGFVDAAEPVKVMVVSRSVFLREATAAITWALPIFIESTPDLEQFLVNHTATIAAVQPDVIILDSAVDVRINEIAAALYAEDPQKPVILAGPQASTEFWRIGPSIEAVLPDKSESHSTWYSNAGWCEGLSDEETTFNDVREIQFLCPHRTLVGGVSDSGSRIPLISALDHGNETSFVLNMHLSKTDFVFRAAFPIVISRLIADAHGRPEELIPVLSTGTTATIRSSSAVHLMKSPVIRAPDGTPFTQARWLRPFEYQNEQWADLGPFQHVGVWKIEEIRSGTSGADSQPEMAGYLCINLDSPEESDLRDAPSPESSQEFAGSDVQIEASSGTAFSENTTALASLLCIVGAIAMCVEWTLFQRQLIQ
ncbi:MAG: BatA and WFA domain-containing protein [Planctomyces sp.]|nr:BatA and WFA domain-containing protein [Planctomyces sp.]